MQRMTGAEVVELPKDRKGRTLRINDEVLLGIPVAQGEVTSMTLMLLDPAAWYFDLHMGAVGDRRQEGACGCRGGGRA
jgi:hypothetical protein